MFHTLTVMFFYIVDHCKGNCAIYNYIVECWEST